MNEENNSIERNRGQKPAIDNNVFTGIDLNFIDDSFEDSQNCLKDKEIFNESSDTTSSQSCLTPSQHSVAESSNSFFFMSNEEKNLLRKTLLEKKTHWLLSRSKAPSRGYKNDGNNKNQTKSGDKGVDTSVNSVKNVQVTDEELSEYEAVSKNKLTAEAKREFEQDDKFTFVDVRVSTQKPLFRYISYCISILTNARHDPRGAVDQIYIHAYGDAVHMAVSVVEIVKKRMTFCLYQQTEIGSITLYNHYQRNPKQINVKEYENLNNKNKNYWNNKNNYNDRKKDVYNSINDKSYLDHINVYFKSPRIKITLSKVPFRQSTNDNEKRNE